MEENKATEAANTDGHRVLGSGYEAKITELEAAHAALLRNIEDKIVYIHDLIAERRQERGSIRRLRAALEWHAGTDTDTAISIWRRDGAPPATLSTT